MRFERNEFKKREILEERVSPQRPSTVTQAKIFNREEHIMSINEKLEQIRA